MSKPKAYGRHVSELPSYQGTYSGNQRSEYIWVNEAGNPILTKDLDKYDTSKRIKWIPSIKSTGQDQLDKADKLMTEKRSTDERIAENYGGEAWGKVGATMLGGAALAGLAPAEVLGAANLGLTYAGLSNFFSPNGYQKTARLWDNGQYGRAVLSGVGDALDISPVPFNIIRGSKTVQGMTKAGRVKHLTKAMDKALSNNKVQTPQMPNNVGWGPRQTIAVTHKSNKATPLILYNENRWDVVHEGANPLGIWYQGKLGQPRIVTTGASRVKANKAASARQLFANRPYTHSGDLTLNKPLVTVGEVPNRAQLSYQAEQLGADGLIYNNVYDNGYNSNQVILSFKQPDNYLLTARAYKGGPRTSSNYEFFTTDPKYAYNYGQVRPYYIKSRFPIVTQKPLMGYRDPATMDMFIGNISKNKHSDAIIGHDKVTGEFPYTSKGDEIIIFNPDQAKLIDTSSKLSSLEKAGVPKIERNFKNHGHDYSNPVNYGKLYQNRRVNPESNQFGKFIKDGSEAFVFEDPNNPNMVLKVNTDWKGPLQEFFEKYVLKRNKVPNQRPLILKGITEEGFPVFNQEKVIPMTDEQYFQNLPKIKEMLYQKGFLGDLETGYISDGNITIGDFNSGNVAFDSKGNIVFIDIDAYREGGSLTSKNRFTFKKNQMVKDAERLNGKRDMRKKLVKSDVVTNKKKRIQKGQSGLKFVSYKALKTPVISEPISNPFSEYNFPSTYKEYLEKPEEMVHQNIETIQQQEPVKDFTVEAAKPVTVNHIYDNKNKWITDLKAAYKRVGITNENALKMLIAQDALESGWGKSAQGRFNYGNLTPGKSWTGAVVNGKDHDSKGNPIKQKFRSYNSIDEYASDKIQFLKALYDFDQNDNIDTFTKKLQGGNKGKRKYAGSSDYIQLVTKIYNTSKI